MASKEELKARLVNGHVVDENDMSDLIEVAGEPGEPGPKGDTGDPGPQGEQGPAGTDGADGFPTEQQWNDLVARVEELENPEA